MPRVRPGWRKGWVPGAGVPAAPFASQGSPGRPQRRGWGLLSHKHLAKWSPSPELEHPVFMKINYAFMMHPVCSGSREDGKELLRYLFC